MSQRLGWAKVKWVGVSLLVTVLSFGLVTVGPQNAYADACSVNGLNCNIGYFFGQFSNARGGNVLTPPAVMNVNNAGALVATIGGQLVCAGGVVANNRNGTGAAFIVLTMLGYPPGTPKNVACQAFGEWANTVQQWAPYTNYNVFYNYGGLNTRYVFSNSDVQYYISAQTSALSIVFYNPANGQPLYAIKKDCANPVGRLQAIPRNYMLTPHVTGISPTEIESGSKMSVTSTVDNTGQVNSGNTQWEITQMTVLPGKKAPHEDEGPTVSGEAPCQSNGGAPFGNYFRSGDSNCKNVTKGAGVFTVGSPSSSLQPGVSGVDIGDVPVGTRICFALSVQPRSNSDGAWAHSTPICTVVGKKPKVQIWGSDVAVRGQIETSTSVKTISGTNKTFGSWVEYGALSTGLNSRFASGSGLNDQNDNNQTNWSRLTFANKDNAGADAFGNYSTLANFRPLPTTAAFFGAIQNKIPMPGGAVDLTPLTFANGGAVEVRTVGNVTISRSNIPVGRSIIVLSSGTVTIADDITYTNAAMNNLQDIPQVVIIAANILIQDNVKQVDAWLVASGIVNTCSNFAGNLTSNKCNNLLTINGPVIAGRLLLNRTAGSGTGAQSGDPAERFNLRPDAYLWAQLQSRGSNKAQTVYSVEEAPRF